MAKQTINIGTTPNDGTGDALRNAFDKTNSNFTELYDGKQDDLVSGTNIKTINGNSVLGSGDLIISGSTANPSVIAASYVDGTSVTGTTANAISTSLLIPANTFTSNGMLEVIARAFKTGSAGNATIRIYLNTSDTLTGATLIATLANTNTQFFQGIRNMSISSNVLSTIQATVSTLSDVSIAGAITSTAFTTSNDYYLLFSIQLANGADSAVIKLARATKYV
jgi:hypothetical protein